VQFYDLPTHRRAEARELLGVEPQTYALRGTDVRPGEDL